MYKMYFMFQINLKHKIIIFILDVMLNYCSIYVHNLKNKVAPC